MISERRCLAGLAADKTAAAATTGCAVSGATTPSDDSDNNRWAPAPGNRIRRTGGIVVACARNGALQMVGPAKPAAAAATYNHLKTTCIAKISHLMKKAMATMAQSEPDSLYSRSCYDRCDRNSSQHLPESELKTIDTSPKVATSTSKVIIKSIKMLRNQMSASSENQISLNEQSVKKKTTTTTKKPKLIKPKRKSVAEPALCSLLSSIGIISCLIGIIFSGFLQQAVECERFSAHHHKPSIEPMKSDGGTEQSQFSDLVAIGAISLIEPATTLLNGTNRPVASSKAPSTSAYFNGRLVDEILSTRGGNLVSGSGDAQTKLPTNKLDYIVDFMRTNKLTKFCDLLTSEEPEIKALNERLNSLNHFTLFVPTNEALLLMPSGQFELIKSNQDETKQFLLAHLTSELVVPRMGASATIAFQPSVVPSGSSNLVQSLAGNLLRVSTVPIQTATTTITTSGKQQATNLTVPQLAPLANNNEQQAPARSFKLELIINGANVVSGHSYALQEPNNSSATYAVVHLIDRALYPISAQTLMDRIRSNSPRMAKYIDKAADNQLKELLESNQERLTTLFLPNEDAFRATTNKLIQHLDTNQTFLIEFLRAHLVEGLYYSSQLASGTSLTSSQVRLESERPQLPNKLSALSGAPLEFETRNLQSRTLILVNSIPILESDLMAVNGVVHIISRPIFGRHLLDECRCANNEPPAARQSANLTELAIYERLWPSRTDPLANNRVDTSLESSLAGPNRRSNLSNWLQSAAIATNNGNELEREESQQQPQSSATMQNQQQVRSRSLRSGIFTRNNRDFYRPSAAPANLLITSKPQQQQAADYGDPKRLDSGNAGGQIFIDKNELNRMLFANNLTETGAKIIDKSRFENEPAQVITEASLKSVMAPSSNSRWEGAQSPPAGANSRVPSSLFEVERYKVVLNATSRQRMREQQRDFPAASTNQFVYDRPLLSSTNAPVNQQQQQQFLPATTEPSSLSKRPYLEVSNTTSLPPSTANNSTGWAANLVDQLSLAASRQQRVLKFQPEDARDPLPGTRIQAFNSSQSSARLNNFQPAYDVFSSSSSSLSTSNNSYRTAFSGKQQAMMGKTVAPSGFGCAFYDSDCKRMVGRLVHLPAHRQLGGSKLKSQSNFQASASNQTLRTSLPEQHLDSTFGEATENPSISNLWNTQTQPSIVQQVNPTQLPKQRLSPANFIRPNPPRVSPLNQPLPPWSDDEHRAGQTSWRSQDADIARIANGKQLQHPSLSKQVSAFVSSTTTDDRFTGGLSRDIVQPVKSNAPLVQPNLSQTGVQHHLQNRPQSPAQILLLPVKVIQEGFVGSPSANQSGSFTRNPTPSPSLSNNVVFSNQQFHTPTPYSVSLITTHMPPIFNNNNNNNNNNSPLGRLTNFTAFETLPADEDPPSRVNLAKKNLRNQQVELAAQVPRAPSAHRKQRLQQIQIDNNGALGANFELNPANGVKQERKIVRIQPAPGVISANPSDFFTGTGGDISITSARLTSTPSGRYGAGNNNFTLGGGLATQASQPTPNVSANFVRSLSEAEQQAAANGDQATDFFQNRTIAEIMDDSGLRIDGQQVTFGRLKDCLAQAELLSLVTQTGNSLTIFMPTDLAFQRLVQQQVVAHQRERQQAESTSARLTIAARLTDPARQHLVPLVARRPSSASRLDERRFAGESANALLSVDPETGAGLATVSAASDRLTLDCASKQVRQILLDHLSSRLVTPKQLQTDMAINSLSGRQLLLSSVPSKKIVVVDGQPVIAATRAKNGMVYVVNKFLNLTQQVPNVMDLIETQPNLTTFLSYLSFSSLANRLRRETGPLTVLAPTNEAFEQLSSSARQLINSDPSALMDILRGHVVEGAQFGKLISMRNRLKTMNADQYIEAKVIKPNVYLLDNQMTSMRLVGTTGNGVVNAIDRLIVPAWLKVSMGNKPTISDASPINSTFTGGASIGSPSAFVGELDASTARASGRAVAGNNLPSIGNRPLKFEQPTERVTTPNNPSGSSFMFAKSEPNRDVSGNNNNNNNNNNLLDFDSPSPAGADNFLSTGIPTSRSPFLRVAANLTGAGAAALARSSHASNVTKNMQLIEKLANLMQARKFVKYLFRSRISESLKADMNYVILVPTDQAIDKLPKQIIDMLDRDSERLADLVNYHVLDTTFEYINTIPDGQTLNTLNEKDILFNWHRNNTILTASGAVVMGGIQEDNIALLIVDRVLYPTPGDILNIISKSPILSNFTSLVRNAGLEQQLSLAGPFTLFAPSDFAFNQLDKADLDFLQRNRETARRFLLRHLSQPAVFTSSIALSNSSQPGQVGRATATSSSVQVPTMTISNSLGEDLTLRQRNDYFSVNEIRNNKKETIVIIGNNCKFVHHQQRYLHM